MNRKAQRCYVHGILTIMLAGHRSRAETEDRRKRSYELGIEFTVKDQEEDYERPGVRHSQKIYHVWM